VRPLVTILTAGLLITLILAWPAAIAAEWLSQSRGWFARTYETVYAVSDPEASPGAVVPGGHVEFATGLLADRYRMFPSVRGTAENPIPAWPSRDMLRSKTSWFSSTEVPAPYRLPSLVAPAPPLDEAMRWGRIDTALAGFPFRCLASEARHPATAWTPPSVPYDPEPEVRYGIELVRVGGERIFFPLRPSWPGLAANVLFWSATAWAAFAIPASIRARKRRASGRCAACGHALAGAANCPECGGRSISPAQPHPLSQPEMLYQKAYVWFVFVSALDVMLTWKILDKGGDEVNPVAREVIELWGFEGAIIFKFAIVTWVVIACELVGRRRPVTGQRLAWTAVAVSAAPVVYSLGLLLDHLVLRPVG
jgi:hypothetical protein